MNRLAVCGGVLKATFIILTFLTFFEFLFYAVVVTLTHEHNDAEVGLTIVYEFFMLIYMVVFIILFINTVRNKRRELVSKIAIWLIVIQIVVILCLNGMRDKFILCEPIGLRKYCETNFWTITVIIAFVKIIYLMLYYSLWATEKIFTLTDGGATLVNDDYTSIPDDDEDSRRNSRIRISALPFAYT